MGRERLETQPRLRDGVDRVPGPATVPAHAQLLVRVGETHRGVCSVLPEDEMAPALLRPGGVTAVGGPGEVPRPALRLHGEGGGAAAGRQVEGAGGRAVGQGGRGPGPQQL